MFNYNPGFFNPHDSMTESELLLLLSEKEQAVRSLESLLEQRRSSEFKKAVMKRIHIVKTDTARMSL
jgi:hypothetical protein